MPTMTTTWTRSLLAALLLLAPLQVVAADTPASDASIRELLEVTESRKLIDAMTAQLDGVMRNSMAQALGDTQLTEEQQKILDDMRQRFVAVMQAEMSWERYEPLMMQVYRQTFTQPEVDGMLAFYRTDAGRAVIAKMPAVMQSSMQLAQEQMAQTIPKLQEIMQESAAKFEATKRKP
jgi:hypothetical protein